MFKKIFIGLALLLPFVVWAQTVTETMDYGESDIQWRVYETDGMVIAFTVSTSCIWFSTGNTVGAYDLKTNQKRAYNNLGDVSSAGIKTIYGDNKCGIWFGGDNGAVLYKNEKFKSFTKKDGLSHNKVNKILCTSSGVWFATASGVSRYHKGTWKVYKEEDGLCGNKVRDIAADDKSTLYFATNKGVAVFDGYKWKKYNTNNGLSSNNAKAIAYDTRKKEIWVAAGEQDVNHYSGKKWNTYMDILMGITCIMADTQSRIWFGSAESGVYKYNGFEWISEPAKIGFPAALVNDMYRDNEGDLYFALESGILHMKNPYPY